MDADLLSRLTYELKLLDDDQQLYSEQLQSLEKFQNLTLHLSVRSGGRTYYSVKENGSKQFRYLGTESVPEVQQIKEARHIAEALRRIDSNIKLVESLRSSFLPYDYCSVDNAIPKAYRSSIAHPRSKYQKAGRIWLEEKLRFQAQFPENYPEKKRERTSNNIWVKSVSEVLLYERFLAAGLIFIYELPFTSGDYGPPMYPDFTILSPIDCKTEIIVEYVGRLDLPQYREDFARRINRYLLNGYIPGVNLFFVFGDIKGHLDSLQISKVIADIKGIR